MSSSLKELVAQTGTLYEKAKFKQEDLFVILQGLTGYFDGGIKNPLATASSILEIHSHFSAKCELGTLGGYLKNIKKWLDFGKAFAALKDSSELDFDKMDVEAVPEVMKVTESIIYVKI